MSAATQRRDARSTTWQFVAPSDAAELLAFADPDDCPREATAVSGGDLTRHLRSAGWPAVAVPDLDAATAQLGRGGAASTLQFLGDQVARGGWLLFGLSNAWYPHRRGPGGALSLARVRRSLRRTGLEIDSLFIALPDHRRPAVLAAAWPSRALDEVGYRLPVTYVSDDSRWPSMQRLVRLLMVAAAAAAPHPLRLRLAPAYLVVARRPA